MKRILLAVAVVLGTASFSQAGCPRQPLFPRLHNAGQRLLGRVSPAPFVPIPSVIPHQMPAFVPDTFNRVSNAVRGLTLLPGSFGGCGPGGCQK